VFTTREVDRKGELATDGHETARDVRPGDGTGVSRVKEQEYRLEGYPDRIALVTHDPQGLIQISIDTLNEHRVVVRTGQEVTINLQKVQRLAAYAKELAVLVQDCHVAKTVSKKNAHEGRSEGGGRGISNRFHASKAAHTACADEVRVRTLEPSVLSSNVCVEVNDQKRSLDRKVVHKF
jgi:hypothetical protein